MESIAAGRTVVGLEPDGAAADILQDGGRTEVPPGVTELRVALYARSASSGLSCPLSPLRLHSLDFLVS
jgi:hypothetical protein